MATWTSQSKTDAGTSQYEIDIGSGYNLLIGSGFKLYIQPSGGVATTWTPSTKN